MVKWKISVRNWYIAWVEWVLICRIYCKIYYPFRIFLLSSRNLSSFYHSLTISYRSFKMFQNEVGTVHWMQWYLDWKFFLKFLNIPNILTCQQAFYRPTHLYENLISMVKRLSLIICQSAWKFVVFVTIYQYLIIHFWSSILMKLIVNFKNKNLIVIFKLCCLKMHRVLGINKGKNNCNFEKERCVIFFNFAGAIVEGDSAKSSIVFLFNEYEIFHHFKLT